MVYIRRDFNSVLEDCFALFLKINKAGIWPHVIIGIARGGWIPARILCDLFTRLQWNRETKSVEIKHPHLLNIGMRRYNVGRAGQTVEKVDFFQRLEGQARKDVDGRIVLVVDEVFDVGKSMQYSLEMVKKAKPDQLHTAILDYKTNAFDTSREGKRREERKEAEANVRKLVNGFFFARKRSPEAWIIYPWEGIEETLGVYSETNSKTEVEASLHRSGLPKGIKGLINYNLKLYEELMKRNSEANS